MTAIKYRMDGGIPGDVNRTHPSSIEPALNDPSTPVTAYGVPVLATSAGNSVRPVASGDTAVTHVYGFSVRPYPINQATTSNSFGAVGYGGGTPPVGRTIDVMRHGY